MEAASSDVGSLGLDNEMVGRHLASTNPVTKTTQGLLSNQEMANSIALSLCAQAIWHGRECNWVGFGPLESSDDVGIGFRSLGPDLYGWTSGIALFLTQGSIGGEDRRRGHVSLPLATVDLDASSI